MKYYWILHFWQYSLLRCKSGPIYLGHKAQTSLRWASSFVLQAMSWAWLEPCTLCQWLWYISFSRNVWLNLSRNWPIIADCWLGLRSFLAQFWLKFGLILACFWLVKQAKPTYTLQIVKPKRAKPRFDPKSPSSSEPSEKFRLIGKYLLGVQNFVLRLACLA